MSILFKKSRKKPGLPPGSLVHVGEQKEERVRITVIDYDRESLTEEQKQDLDEVASLLGKPTTTWINVDGIHEVDTLKKIGDAFSIHLLVLEDVLNTYQRPKMEDYGEYLFIVLKMFYWPEGKDEFVSEQVSLVLGKNYVISFQESEGDVFEPVRQRIRNAKGRIRSMGADYLAYALLDAVVDNYFVIMERIGERIEELDELVYSEPTPETLKNIHALKRQVLILRKSISPLRELMSGILRGDSELIDKETGLFIRDLHDHTIQVVDTIDSFRDIMTGLLDIYLSSVSNRMNEVMKVLTIMATIFIPLSFLAGVYGMNFDYIPELKWRYSYLIFWGIIVLASGSMLIYFRKKKWI